MTRSPCLTVAVVLTLALAAAGCTGPAMRPAGVSVAAADTVQIDGSLTLSAAGDVVSDATAARIEALAASRGAVGVAQGLITTPHGGRRADSVAAALRAQGVAPIIMVEPEAREIEVLVFRTLPEGCPDWAAARLAAPTDAITLNRNPFPAQRLELGCDLRTALDAMVVNPRDLTDPPLAMRPAPAAAHALAAERYRTTGPRPLPAIRSVAGSR